MPDGATPSPDDARKGFSVDLSTGKPPRRRKRKGPPPVVQQTINLSTPKPPKAEAPATHSSADTEAPKGGRKKGSTSGTPRTRARPAPRSGTSLADLLDPETLARLRGDG